MVRVWSGYGQIGQDVVEKAIEMPLSRMRWGDEEMGQRQSQVSNVVKPGKIDGELQEQMKHMNRSDMI